jgi:hypothetical protein
MNDRPRDLQVGTSGRSRSSEARRAVLNPSLINSPMKRPPCETFLAVVPEVPPGTGVARRQRGGRLRPKSRARAVNLPLQQRPAAGSAELRPRGVPMQERFWTTPPGVGTQSIYAKWHIHAMPNGIFTLGCISWRVSARQTSRISRLRKVLDKQNDATLFVGSQVRRAQEE